jgi:hypothetical protein
MSEVNAHAPINSKDAPVLHQGHAFNLDNVRILDREEDWIKGHNGGHPPPTWTVVPLASAPENLGQLSEVTIAH